MMSFVSEIIYPSWYFKTIYVYQRTATKMHALPQMFSHIIKKLMTSNHKNITNMQKSVFSGNNELNQINKLLYFDKTLEFKYQSKTVFH